MGKLKPFKEGCQNKWISFGMEKKNKLESLPHIIQKNEMKMDH